MSQNQASLSDQLAKTLPPEAVQSEKGRGVFHGGNNWHKQIQEELIEFDESHMLILKKLTEVVQARKEKEEREAELNATTVSNRLKGNRSVTRSQISRSVKGSEHQIFGTVTNSMVEFSTQGLKEESLAPSDGAMSQAELAEVQTKGKRQAMKKTQNRQRDRAMRKMAV